jgi:hypothetical protein
MCGGIQDGLAWRGNSFHQWPRNLFPGLRFHAVVPPPKVAAAINRIPLMKTTLTMTLFAMIGSSLIVSAQEVPKKPERQERPERPARQIPPEFLKKYDKDGDGKLSPDEMTAFREARIAEMEAKKKEALSKYDTDGDGKLNEEERTKMREAMQAEMLKKYDLDGDGKLSDEEKAKMPRRPDFPGGPPKSEVKPAAPAAEGPKAE